MHSRDAAASLGENSGDMWSHIKGEGTFARSRKHGAHLMLALQCAYQHQLLALHAPAWCHCIWTTVRRLVDTYGFGNQLECASRLTCEAGHAVQHGLISTLN